MSFNTRGCYAAKQEPTPGSKATSARIFRLQGKTWEPCLRLKFQRPAGLWELPFGKYLVMSDPGFTKDGRISPFAIMKEGPETWLEVEELVDVLGDCMVPPSRQDLRGGMARWYYDNLLPEWVSLNLDRLVPLLITTEDHITWLSCRTGTAFVLDANRGRFLRRALVYPGLLEKPFRGMAKDAPILFAQPMPTGELFLAVRSQEAVVAGPKVFLEPVSSGHGDRDGQRGTALSAAAKDMVRAYGEIRYLLFDPNLGKFADTFRPDGMPSTLGSLELAKDFAFHVDLSGKIRHGAPPEEGTPLKSPPPGSKK